MVDRPTVRAAHFSSGTNSAGISASNMLPLHDGTTRMPAYGRAASKTSTPK